MVVERGLLGVFSVALAQIKRKPTLVLLDADQRVEALDGAIDYAAEVVVASARAPAGADDVSGADPGAVMNTSGTTGPSKGVRLSHAQQYILGRMIGADMGLRADDVFYNFYPLFHNTAQAMITVPVLLVGARMILTDKFSASRFWPEVIAHRCTAFYYIGEIMRILLKSTTAADARGAQLRVGWGIGAAAKDFVEFQQRFGVTLRTGYGSTEANVPCYLPHGSTNVESVGRAVAGFEIRIANDRGEPVEPGMQGEILVRSHEPCALMLAYDGDADATVAAWQDLWFHSGDAGVLDADGNLYFKGRVKDSIRVRGENVSAFEVEQALGEVDGVLEIAAVAVPSELGGDDIKVVVVIREGAAITPEMLVAHAQSQLPRYAVPRYVEFVSALPKTPTNKVQKHVLRAQPFTASTWDRTQSTATGSSRAPLSP
jgi:crotonobetaine/carnitine-CoA ligase